MLKKNGMYGWKTWYHTKKNIRVAIKNGLANPIMKWLFEKGWLTIFFIELFCQNILLPGKIFIPPWNFTLGIWAFLCQNHNNLEGGGWGYKILDLLNLMKNLHFDWWFKNYLKKIKVVPCIPPPLSRHCKYKYCVFIYLSFYLLQIIW